MGVPYPVGQDNDVDNWQAPNARLWPTLFLFDKKGNIRNSHIGGGAYKEIEDTIQVMLAEEYL